MIDSDMFIHVVVVKEFFHPPYITPVEVPVSISITEKELVT